jgi:hypothetical protein
MAQYHQKSEAKIRGLGTFFVIVWHLIWCKTKKNQSWHLKTQHYKIQHYKIQHYKIQHYKIQHYKIQHYKIQHYKILHLKITLQN